MSISPAWLESLGLHQRAEALSRARPDLADTLRRQAQRLTAPDQMGELFKVLVLGHGPAWTPMGFDNGDRTHAL